MLRIYLANPGKSLAGSLQVTISKIHFTQPVLSIASIDAFRISAQKRSKGLTGLIEILGFDQVEGSIVVQLFLQGRH